MAKKANTIKMYLCEVQYVFLKPNRKYVFKVDENCEKCKKLAHYANGGH